MNIAASLGLLVLICSVIAIKGEAYDFITLGVGTSASVLAKDLSDVSSQNILGLERGDDLSDTYSNIVALWNAPYVGAPPAFYNRISSLPFYTEQHISQEPTAMDGRSIPWYSWFMAGVVLWEMVMRPVVATLRT